MGYEAEMKFETQKCFGRKCLINHLLCIDFPSHNFFSVILTKLCERE